MNQGELGCQANPLNNHQLPELFSKALTHFPYSFFLAVDKSTPVVGSNSIPSGDQLCAKSNRYSHCAVVMVHELAHVIQQLTGVISPSKWAKARKLDKKKYCSKYAMTNTKEDFAESVICWIAVRHKPDKITQFDVKKINHFITNRLKFFDEMNFNMYPM